MGKSMNFDDCLEKYKELKERLKKLSASDALEYRGVRYLKTKAEKDMSETYNFIKAQSPTPVIENYLGYLEDTVWCMEALFEKYLEERMRDTHGTALED